MQQRGEREACPVCGRSWTVGVERSHGFELRIERRPDRPVGEDVIDRLGHGHPSCGHGWYQRDPPAGPLAPAQRRPSHRRQRSSAGPRSWNIGGCERRACDSADVDQGWGRDRRPSDPSVPLLGRRRRRLVAPRGLWGARADEVGLIIGKPQRLHLRRHRRRPTPLRPDPGHVPTGRLTRITQEGARALAAPLRTDLPARDPPGGEEIAAHRPFWGAGRVSCRPRSG